MNLANRRRHRILILLVGLALGTLLVLLERAPAVDVRMDALPGALP